MSAWSKSDRLAAALAGERADHPAASAYLHTTSSERTAADLVAATLDFQRKWDWDWIKLNPRTVHYAEAWGNVYDYDDYPTPLPIPAQRRAAVESPAETWRLERLRIDEVPQFQEQLQVIRDVVAAEPDTPVFATVYSPLNVFLKIAGLPAWSGDLDVPGSSSTLRFSDYIAHERAGVHHALHVIASTLADYAEAYRRAGASGLFFVEASLANTEFLSEAFFNEFSRPYDAITLEGGAGLTRVVHTCGGDSKAPWFEEFPLEGINWDSHDVSNPPIDVELNKTKFVGVSHTLLGGLTSGPLADTVKRQVAHARATLDDRFVLAPSCSIPAHTSDEALSAYREAALA